MNHNKIKEKIINVLKRQLQRDDIEINATDNLKEDLGLDSFDMTEFAIVLEDEFDIEIDDENLSKMETVFDIYRIIKNDSKIIFPNKLCDICTVEYEKLNRLELYDLSICDECKLDIYKFVKSMSLYPKNQKN